MRTARLDASVERVELPVHHLKGVVVVGGPYKSDCVTMRNRTQMAK
jgi:hypothetical protein